MEKPERDAEQSTPQYSAPILPENAGEAYVAIPEPQPFTATLRERLLALLIYIPAYLYCCSWNTGYAFLIFCAFFIAMTEWCHWEEKRSFESWVWLGCLAVTVLSAPLGRNRVWGDLRLLFAHGFAIYWVLCRSGRLRKRPSSAARRAERRGHFPGEALFPAHPHSLLYADASARRR